MSKNASLNGLAGQRQKLIMMTMMMRGVLAAAAGDRL
jgi:hypothetical protein